ncbi:glycosyltransferase [Flavobacterium sp. CFS9]|uniref:Glycosyltransferase n=1 Tax=Flavobacterium sp. CFS9 TaxID=3143118 RepID=A0AAT9GXW2_9FLAO
MPLVSVIVTTYNRKDLLAETLNSILNQTFQDFELIVVDNFSAYDFFTHIESFKSAKIKCFQNHNNGIIAINRNYGLKQATGSYIAFCDDDDIWFSNKLETQVAILNGKSDQTKKLVYSDVLLFGENISEKISNRKATDDINDLIKRNQIPLSSTLISYSDLVIFNEDSDLIACEDFYLWLKLMKNGYSFFYIKEPLIKYRMAANSAYNSNAHLAHVRTIYALIKYVINFGFEGVNMLGFVKVVYTELFKFYIKNLKSKLKSNA